MEYQKVKSVAKEMTTKGPQLKKKVLTTMRTIADMVGATLGPGGQPVIIERYEHGLPCSVTKDGVSVFKAMGFKDPTMQCIMETARDAAMRTASEAGDGPQPRWSKILTPKGFIAMGEVEPGMTICGTNGTTQTVMGVFPQGQKEIIKITFDHGQVVECCEDHLWRVSVNRCGTSITLNATTKDMLKDFSNVEKTGYTRYKYYVPPHTAVEFNKQDLSIDPYTLGALIGDGCLRDSGSIELSLGYKKKHVIDKLKLPEGILPYIQDCVDRNSYRVKLRGEDGNGRSIRDLLGDTGLKNVNSSTKHIPFMYLHSSIEDRQALLRGLLDTDGYINKNTGRFELSTISEQLCKDFVYLCRSLGIPVGFRLKKKKEEWAGSYSLKPIYIIYELKGCKHGNNIVNIERTGKFTEMRCIKVSNPDHLYITDDFIVTHNTTTATILAESIVRKIYEYCEANPRISPQKIVRSLENIFRTFMDPQVMELSKKIDFDSEEGQKDLRQVAVISANGDEALADAVLECFALVGDQGNVTITELSGPSSYQVEKIEGYPIPTGYEDSCRNFYEKFVNDPGSLRSYLENCYFLVYHGKIQEFQSLFPVFSIISEKWEHYMQTKEGEDRHNLVIVATEFSEKVLGHLALNFPNPSTLNILPLLAPKTPQQNGQLYFLQDIAAFTGATILDPLQRPLDSVKLEDLGFGESHFEMNRYRSSIFGVPNEDLILELADQVQTMVDNPESELDRMLSVERLGKLTGGIAKLKVIGPSSGELKEKRDRAEDAVCAVKGAIKLGCLPGGGWTLLKLVYEMSLVPELANNDFVNQILAPAMMEPLNCLLSNAGLKDFEIHETIKRMVSYIESGENQVYDALNHKFVDPFESGVLDSTPAVLEAIRNSLSIASLLGTLGGAIVFGRDLGLERQEASDTQEYLRNVNTNEANERI